jgi:hypothetical protein
MYHGKKVSFGMARIGQNVIFSIAGMCHGQKVSFSMAAIDRDLKVSFCMAGLGFWSKYHL